MIIEFLNNISVFIQSHTEMMYIAAFFAATVEGTIFLAFIPGSTFILSLGVFAAKGDISISLLFFVVVIGAFLGDNLGYLIGRFFGRRILKFEWIDKEYYVFAESFILKNGKKSIFVSRFIPVMKEVAPFIAGILDMDRKSFIVWNLAGGFLWSIVWIGAGYFFGGNINSVLGILKIIAIIGFMSFSSWIISYYFKNKDELIKQKIIIDEVLKKDDKLKDNE